MRRTDYEGEPSCQAYDGANSFCLAARRLRGRCRCARIRAGIAFGFWLMIRRSRERTMSIRKNRTHDFASSPPEPVAGNGLLHRRALLERGVMLAGAAATGAGSQLASAEPLTNGPWSLAPGVPIPPYGQPSKFEQKVVRTLSNPK